MGVGRQLVYTEEKLNAIIKAIEEYTETAEVPIIAEFAYNYGILREELYKHDELKYAIRNLITKKEFSLEKKAMDGETNHSFAIFSLKQLGWRDKQEIEHTVDTSVIDSLRDKYENK